ncbi:MAG: beta-lactamase family protein [Saprospiraceae bacterium]|nr:beta-lactamase family protein [Pyrinomonadaceae bacterium]
MRTTRNFILFFLILSFAVGSPAQDPSKRVDDFIAVEMTAQKIPGVSVAVVRDGKPMIVKGYGLANVEHQVAVKPETIFQSGSVGKQFTAMAVMILVDEGKIVLDEKIGKYLGPVPETWKDITVRHLLTHTGGMTDYTEDFNLWQDYTEEELLKKAQAVPTAFAPGERWQYSNLGYLTLGVLIRKVSGKFYGDYLQERVFKPLGMTTARVISEADIIPNRAMGYRLASSELKHQHWVAPQFNTTADGALYLTVLDMIKWDYALTKGMLIKKESYAQMWTPVKLNNGRTANYGFGWMLEENANGRKVIEHGGAWQGFKAHIARYPDDKLTVIVLANLAQANQGRLARGIAEAYEPGLIPKPIEDPEPQATALFRDQLKKMSAGIPDLDLFTAEMQKNISGPQDRFTVFIKSLGEIKKFELMARKVTADEISYRYRIEFTTETAYMNVTKRTDGKIAALGFQPA